MLSFLYVCIILSLINAYGYGIYDIMMAIYARNFRIPFTKRPVRNINKVYLIIPAMNESRVILRCVHYLVRAIKFTQSIQPSISCTLIFTDDASTDGTSQKLDRTSQKYSSLIQVIHRRLPNAQRGKGMALNNALRWINQKSNDPHKTIIGIIDSDSTPQPSLIIKLVQAFEYSHADIIQTAILMNNANSFLTVMQRFEFGVPNFLAQLIRTRVESGLASGNGQFVTLKIANAIRWRKSLLDDLEFSINGLLRNFKGIFLPTVSIPQEAVVKYSHLLKQRTRWCQGGMQCLFKYGPRIIRSPYINTLFKIGLIFEMATPLFSIILEPCSLISMLVIIYYLAVSPLTTILPIILILATNILITFLMILSVKHINNRSFKSVTGKHSIEIIMGNLIYLWLMSPVPYIAVFRLITHKNTWSKTNH